MIAALRDDSAGCYLVSTKSGSIYLLDFDSRTLCRIAGMRTSDLPRMRRDCDEIRLIRLVECVVGSPMTVLVDLRVPHVVMTRRRSTDVVQIAQLPHDTPLTGQGRR